MLALIVLTGPEHGELLFSRRLFYTPAGMIRSFCTNAFREPVPVYKDNTDNQNQINYERGLKQ